MKNLRIYCFFCVFMLLACLSASNAFAQGSSFKDVEKMRKEEEKNRAKLAQKNAKDKPQKTSTSPTNEDNTWQNDKKGKGKDKGKGPDDLSDEDGGSSRSRDCQFMHDIMRAIT